MKSFLLVLSMVVFSFVNAQEGTTQEEYNYVTKGYLVTIQQGLDIKSGYTTKDAMGKIYADNSLSKFIEAKYLIKSNDTKRRFACVMLLYYQNNTLNRVFCLPHYKSDEEIKQQYYKDIDATSYELKKLITIVLSEVFTFAFSK